MSQKSFDCDQCTTKYNHPKDLTKHKKAEHGVVGAFKCDKCDASYMRKEALNIPQKTVHEGQAYSCEHCDFKAAQRVTLKNHFFSKHQNLRFDCDIDSCTSSFTEKGNLKKHKVVKHSGIVEYFNCTECEYKSVYKQSVKDHMNKHSSEKFECNLCHAMLNSKAILRLHKRSVHENMKLHKCVSCSKSFGEKHVLQIHIKAIHEKVKDYKCTVNTPWK